MHRLRRRSSKWFRFPALVESAEFTSEIVTAPSVIPLAAGMATTAVTPVMMFVITGNTKAGPRAVPVTVGPGIAPAADPPNAIFDVPVTAPVLYPAPRAPEQPPLGDPPCVAPAKNPENTAAGCAAVVPAAPCVVSIAVTAPVALLSATPPAVKTV